MSSGLVGAAIASGLGQGMAQVAQTGMNVLGASWLQQQRELAEQRRLEVMERYASEREGRSYAHAETMQKQGFEHADTQLQKQQDFSRGLQQEQFGQNQLAADLAIQRQESAAARERDRLRSPEEIEKDEEAKRTRFEKGADLRMAERTENTLADADKERFKAELLGNDPIYLASVKKLKDAQESEGDRAEAGIKVLQLQQSKDAQRLQTDYVEAVKSGDQAKIATAKKAWQAFSEKPWEDDKLTAKMASDGLRESRNQIDHLSALMKDHMPGSPEAANLQRRINTAQDSFDAYDTILKTRLGVQAPTAKKGPDFANFKDPLKPDTATAKTEGLPPSPAPPSREIPVVKTEPLRPGNAGPLGDYLADKGDMIAAIPPGQNPTDASSFLTQKRQELDERLAKEPSGMTAEVGRANTGNPSRLQEEPVTKEPIADIKTPVANVDYEPYIQEATKQYPNVRPELVRAVVAAESNGDRYAVSKKGATGPMQFMEGTAKQYGVEDRTDPRQSILGGTHYLSDLLKKYNGDESQALAAYNFGPRNVDEGRPWPKETQAYVAKVLGNAESGNGPSVRTAEVAPEAPTYLDALNRVPPGKREYVRSELDRAVSALRSGEITDEQFKQQVTLAWTAVPEDDPVKWAQDARALANGLITEAKGRR